MNGIKSTKKDYFAVFCIKTEEIGLASYIYQQGVIEKLLESI